MLTFDSAVSLDREQLMIFGFKVSYQNADWIAQLSFAN